MSRYLIPIYLIISGLILFQAFIPFSIFDSEPEYEPLRGRVQQRFRLGEKDFVPVPSLFSQVADEFKVPVELLQAIASHESRYSPWAVNIAGRSYYPGTKQAAMDIIDKAGAKSFDVGLMQVNSYWLNKFDLAPEKAIVPEENLRLGAWVLRYCLDRYGDNWKAVGAYHTGSPDNMPRRAKSYARRVLKKYRQLTGVD